MRVTPSALPEVLVIEPLIHADDRGLFFEIFNQRAFRDSTGLDLRLVQENQSQSKRQVVRGLHYQIRQPQGKLVRVVAGESFHAVVDLRRSSQHYGQSTSVCLSASSRRVLWVPPGFAHGLLALRDLTEVAYMVTDFYAPEHERCLLWNDPVLGIDWPIEGEPLLSEKDRRGLPLSEAETYP